MLVDRQRSKLCNYFAHKYSVPIEYQGNVRIIKSWNIFKPVDAKAASSQLVTFLIDVRDARSRLLISSTLVRIEYSLRGVFDNQSL